jgi:hypothetical protein
MTRLLLLCLFVSPLPVASAQKALPDTSRAVIDSVYALVKEHSLFRNGADWTSIDTTFEVAVDTADTFAERLGAFRGVFQALGDVHSAVYYAGTGIAYRPQPSQPALRDVDALIMLSRERANQPEGYRRAMEWIAEN